MAVEIPYNFSPRSYQKRLFQARQRGINRFFYVWHRRAGKDKTCINFTAKEMIKRVGGYYYILPTYSQAKKIIWDGRDANGFKFTDHFPQELIARKHEAELKIELVNGSIFQLLGSDNIDRIVGVNPVGVVFSEYSLQDPRVYDFYRPILNENAGWALFNGTPRGRNHFHDLYMAIKDDPKWDASILTIEDTLRDAPGESGGPVVTKEMIEQDLNEGAEPELVRQENYCDFSGVTTGTYYAKLLEQSLQDGRVTDVPWNPRLSVFTVWDLGVADAMTVIFCQIDAQRVNVIDYIERRGEGLGYFAREIKNRAYLYSNHYAPHDIQNRELSSGKSRLELARDLGLPFQIAPNISVQDGIDSLRSLFPRLWFDKTKCARLIQCLTNYHKTYDSKKREFLKQPVHDWSSHGADAARYLSLVYDREYDYRNTPITATGMRELIFDNAPDESSPYD